MTSRYISSKLIESPPRPPSMATAPSRGRNPVSTTSPLLFQGTPRVVRGRRAPKPPGFPRTPSPCAWTVRSAASRTTGGSREGLPHLVGALHEPVDLVGRVVDIEARARRRRDAEPVHRGRRAVVRAADGDAFPVEYLGYVVGMHALEHE